MYCVQSIHANVKTMKCNQCGLLILGRSEPGFNNHTNGRYNYVIFSIKVVISKTDECVSSTVDAMTSWLPGMDSRLNW